MRASVAVRAVVVRLLLVALVTSAVLVLAAQLGGLGVARLTSGSMAPSAPAGTLAVTREVRATGVDVGDVVRVGLPDGGNVTHRVVATRPATRGAVALELRGDANRSTDPAPYVVHHVDTVLVMVPGMGDARKAWAAVAAALLLTAVVVRRRPRHRRGRAGHVPASASAGTTVTVLLALVAATAAPTAAAWTDSAMLTSGEVATLGAVPSPTQPTCAAAGSGVDASWADVGVRYRYRASLLRVGDEARLGSVVDLPPSGGSRATHRFGAGTFGGLPSDGVLNAVVRVEALPAAAGSTWVSPRSVDVAVHATRDRGALRCGHDTTTSVTTTGVVDDSGLVGDDVTNVRSNALRGTAEARAVVVVRRGGTVLATTTADRAGSWTSPRFDLAEGSQSLQVTATDEAGNTASASRTVVLDTVAPRLTTSIAACPTVGNPVVGADGVRWCRATTLRWTVEVDDPGSGVPTDAVQVSEGDGAWHRYDGGLDLREGAGRAVRVRATDRAGNEATAEDRTWLDGTPPRVTLSYPNGGGTLLSGTLLAGLGSVCGSGSVGCGTVEDDASGVAQVRWSLERSGLWSGWLRDTTGATFASPETLHDAQLSGDRWTAGVRSPSLVYSGLLRTYTLRVAQATDEAGNVAWSPVATSFYVALF
ncbi:MAG: Ig-like domain-containing protein [Propionibacteriales bacterium]|nr:Ig-like domain-containing protein [Propionibacteriales bacterium]